MHVCSYSAGHLPLPAVIPFGSSSPPTKKSGSTSQQDKQSLPLCNYHEPRSSIPPLKSYYRKVDQMAQRNKKSCEMESEAREAPTPLPPTRRVWGPSAPLRGRRQHWAIHPTGISKTSGISGRNEGTPFIH